jgi:hypothetical protein
MKKIARIKGLFPLVVTLHSLQRMMGSFLLRILLQMEALAR